MSSRPLPVSSRPGCADLWLLARWRLRQLGNLADQQLREAPGRTLLVAGLLALIWAALYFLLREVLQRVHSWGQVGAVADQHLFVHFFVVLAIMLAFSNAILTFGSLYGREEAGFLLVMPLDAHAVVVTKWIEGIILSSWSFLLLGIPLMLAVAHNSPVEWYYYPLFLGHFLGFVAIPACVGLLAGWLVAMWVPRRPVMVAVCSAALVLVLGVYWLSSISRNAVEAEEWLRVAFKQMGVIKQPLIPSTWTAVGIAAALEHRVGDSLFYLAVTVGNAAFLSWLTINILARWWPEAYSRAQRGRQRQRIESGWLTALVCNVLFFYLPRKLRRVMLKDLRAFARDARQWSQMVIMFGLLVVYVLNLRRLPVDIDQPQIKSLIAFLNLTTVSLILATFTSRFVYPLLSLESQQLWLLELLPLRRATLLLVKFLFALTVTGLSAVFVMGLAVDVLNLPAAYAWTNVMVCLGICVGLSGLSIGLGARFPVLASRNPARIASGFGGTLNLIVSMAFVALELTGVGMLTFREMHHGPGGGLLSPGGKLMLGALLAVSGLVAAGALWIGTRHFSRLEC